MGHDARVDRIDRAIVEQLRQNCRRSNVELADAVGLTPSPCLRRVQRLEEEGVITGYHASVAPAAIDRAFEVLVDIELSEHTPATTKAFEAGLVGFVEVVEARRTFGQMDYQVLVGTRDLAAYEVFVTERLMRLPGLLRMQSRFSMVTLKADPPRTPVGFPR